MDRASTIDDDANDGAGGAAQSSIRIPLLNARSSSLITNSDFMAAYGTHRAVHIRGTVTTASSTSSTKGCDDPDDATFRAGDVRRLYDSMNDEDKESWCVEDYATMRTTPRPASYMVPPRDFLDIENRTRRGYCSFIVQHSTAIMEGLVTTNDYRLPVVHLPVADVSGDIMNVKYGPCLWVFFGKNYPPANDNDDDGSSSAISGRPEHTDSVSHDGTWHYQLSGTKIWRLRPTTELLRIIEGGKRERERHLESSSGSGRSGSGTKRKIDDAMEAGDSVSGEEDRTNDNDTIASPKDSCIEVECKQGDILFLNTRLWWHSTLIPPQDVPSISYARDIYFINAGPRYDTPRDADGNENVEVCDGGDDVEGGTGQEETGMTNVDGTYATEDIAAETILFTERNMPECELHRSSDPNCRVVELEDDYGRGGSYMAVVTLRDIRAGEFFSVEESDEEDESDSSGEVDGDWDDDDDDEVDRCIIAPK
jgi:hypothetical protein